MTEIQLEHIIFNALFKIVALAYVTLGTGLIGLFWYTVIRNSFKK